MKLFSEWREDSLELNRKEDQSAGDHGGVMMEGDSHTRQNVDNYSCVATLLLLMWGLGLFFCIIIKLLSLILSTSVRPFCVHLG
ncbi:hypothetical protein ACOMHN_003079 [Nucella lapillus]